ncbi:MAG: hypothetical protein JWP85_1977 [Rhodoglobus sp.]|nr:hypothetical protein [Rhodoglobus sp.]
MAEIDELLSSTLKRVAQPGDPAGVADAIRSRVDAGDTGTPAASSGFGAGGVAGWLPWIGLVVVAGLVGGAIGATGVLGASGTADAADRESILTSGSIDNTTEALGCPGGVAVSRLEPGQRVLIVARSDDSHWLGVRDPLDLGRTVWLPIGVVAVDAGQDGVGTLPVGGCPAPLVAQETPVPVPPAPEPAPEPEPEPEPLPEPVPVPADTTGPVLGQSSASPNPISMEGYPECGPTLSTVSVFATDPSGVASVSASWSGGGAALVPSGTMWSFPFSEGTIGFANTVYTITLTAVDALGNATSTAVNVTVLYCLI